MGIMDRIKQESQKTGSSISTAEELHLETILNKMFYLDRKVERETKFIREVMTRGLGDTERKGLHASSLIVSDEKFCLRQQVLSLMYKQSQGEQLPVNVIRIFEEGNAIHEKWQRLFIRAGYANFNTLDRTRFDADYQTSYSPDVVCRIPEFYNGRMVCEIKSVNTYQYAQMERHPSAYKQLQFYMFLCRKAMNILDDEENPDYKKGFVLCEDKNTQAFKVEIYDFDYEFVKPFVERCEKVREKHSNVVRNGKMVKRHKDCDSVMCKMAETCPMRDACYNVGMGRVKL